MASAVKEVLDHLGLTGYPKLSGATGIHIYVPLEPKYTYAVTSGLAGLHRPRGRGRPARRRAPTSAWSRTEGRPGLRGSPAKPSRQRRSSRAYSARPKAGAPVSVPFFWEELDFIHPAQFPAERARQAALPPRSPPRNASRSPRHRRPHLHSSVWRSTLDARPAVPPAVLPPLVVREVPPLRRRNLCTSEWL